MNLRFFSFVLMVSALPLLALAESSEISLNRGDFVSAERLSRKGEPVLRIKLSKSGRSKFKRLNKHWVGKEVHSEIAGVSSNFKLREPIKGEALEVGPFSTSDAEKVVAAINSK